MIVFEDGIQCSEGIKKANLIVYSIHKDDLIERRFSKFENILENLKLAGKDARGKLFLTFDGYDNDSREIYLIPEIRAFVKYFYDKCNYLFYFLTSLDNNRSIIFACINACKSYKVKGEDEVTVEIIFNEKIMMQTVYEILKYGQLQNDLEETKKLLDTFIG